MATYKTARLDDIGLLADGPYRYRPVRHHLGITRFGVTAWVGAAAGTRRTAVAAEPATTILAIDGAPGKAYDATGWELWAPVSPLYDAGEHAELSARLAELIAANPQYPMLLYNLACSESLTGRTSDAIDHLRRAIDASEKFRADARADSDFDRIRDEPAFKALIGEVPPPR